VRQRVEHQRAMEEERTRIAQDLHDELGSGITEMSMLAARAKSTAAANETRGQHLDQVGIKARELVTALDEIVWAMNPRHDSLASLISYFSLYADRFLGLANISWKLDAPGLQVDLPIDSKRRHQLFLAFKEALTNVVRHSGGSEVQIKILDCNQQLQLRILDNGRGLPPDLASRETDGIANMRSRLEKLGGRIEITNNTPQGTSLLFELPVT